MVIGCIKLYQWTTTLCASCASCFVLTASFQNLSIMLQPTPANFQVASGCCQAKGLAANKQACLSLTARTRLMQLCGGISEPSGTDALMPAPQPSPAGLNVDNGMCWQSRFHMHACMESREPAKDKLSYHAGGVCTID